MTTQTYTPELGLRTTASAAEHIRKQLRQNPGAAGLRVSLKPSGCSGYMYVVNLVETPDSEDHQFQVADDINLFVDNKSLPLLNGTEIDFVTEGLNSMFQFRNPNAESECGCGESISIKQPT
jgi:iron-sulfur cluster assembly accessory protein